MAEFKIDYRVRREKQRPGICVQGLFPFILQRLGNHG